MLSLALLGMALTAPAFEPRACPPDLAADPSITCGVVRVPENRRDPLRRTLELNVVVLASTADSPTLPPLVDLDGGPGFASTRSAAFYRTDGLAYRAQRAVVLMDQRGTGASNALTCSSLASGAARLEPMYPAAAVAQCRDELSARADLTQYDTTAAAADLDAVRVALGYERIDIVAISYGTTLALRYLADFPGRVRAAVLNSVVPTAAMPPQHHAAIADAALKENFADCRAEPACRAAFPDLETDLERALQKATSSQPPIESEVFLEKIRTLLYSPLTARQVPRIVHHAARGDLAPLMKWVSPTSASEFADGLYLSVTCAESIALMDYEAAAREARATRFGDYRLRRQQSACAQWPTGQVARDFLQPVRSDAPILLISGGRDPVTPAAWASDAARTLPHARHIVLPWSGHSFDGLAAVDTCYDAMVLRFFVTGDAGQIDTTCVAGMLPPPFAVDRPES